MRELYFTHDVNFNVTAAVEEPGATIDIIERYEYDPYGRVSILDSDFSDDADGVSDIEQDVLFTGYRLDPETTIYEARNRYFHSALGRWIQRDPLGTIDGMNLYQYVRSNPLVYTDPSGTVTALVGCLIGGVISGTTQYIYCLLRWWDTGRDCIREGMCAVLAGCVEGMLLSTGIGGWIGGCFSGVISAIVGWICNSAWACIENLFNGLPCGVAFNTCDLTNVVVSAVSGCVGGIGAEDPAQSIFIGVTSFFLGYGGHFCLNATYPNGPTCILP